MLTQEPSSQYLPRFIKGAIQSEIDRIIAEETETAVKQVEQNVRKRVKEMTVQVAANVMQRFEMHQHDNILTIRVNFGEDKA